MLVVSSANARGWVVSIAVLLVAVSAYAADRYSSGTKTWDSVTVNWADTTGAPYTDSAWNNSTPDRAVFEGTAGTVTLSENITSTGIQFDVTGYIITNTASETISFSGGSTIRCDVASAIIAPDLSFAEADTILGGTGVGTLDGIISAPGGAYGASRLVKQDSGTWVINGGCPGTYQFGAGVDVNGGILKANAYISVGHVDSVRVNAGGEFHWNAPDVVDNPGGNSNGLNLDGGKLDNSRGASVVSSNGCSFSLTEDSTFIGSLGASSDLRLIVRGTWTDGKKLTVSNAATTLTLQGEYYGGGLGGPDAAGIIKDGAGTLVLTSNINYTGNTTIEDGVLSMTEPYMAFESYLYLTNSAVLNLDFVGTNEVMAVYTNGGTMPAGEWGAVGSGAPNETAWLTGSGRINVLYGEPIPGKRWWDGGSVDIGTDGNAASAGGAGTWDSTTKNWDCGFPVAHTNWVNTSNDVAYIKGATGEISVAETITLGGIYLDADEDGYIITNGTLSFTANSTIELYDTVTIASDITNEPTITANGNTIYLIATNSIMLGDVTNNTYTYLDGSGTGIISGTMSSDSMRPYKRGSGTWIVGTVTGRRGITLDEGILKVTNALSPYSDVQDSLDLNGGEYHVNSSSALASENGGGNYVTIDGGALDNSSGAAITSTAYARQRWRADFSFVGSGGANSDLDLGTSGSVTLQNADRTITVSNAATEFAVGIPIGDGGNGYGLTKEGAGKLRLYAENTYSGDTVVNDGTLEIEGNRALVDGSSLWITNTAVVNLPAGVFEIVGSLYLDGTLYTNETWGSTSSGAQNKNDTYFSGSGILSLGSRAIYTSGTKDWDTATVNWGVTSGGPYNAVPWPNSSPVESVFEGSAGTTTITGGAMTNSGMRFDVAGHTISNATAGDVLAFRNDSTIRCDVASAVIGPEIYFPESDMTLTGTGTGTINGYISAPGGAYGAARLVKEGTGKWIINGGCQNTYEFGAGVDIDSGVLVANAWISVGHTDAVRVNSGGEFHYNKQGVIVRPGGNANNLRLDGGKLDNVGGSAITENTTFSFYVDDDSVFIGSLGASSDIEFIGNCYWTDGKTLTVSNALTTLEFSGVVQSANSTGIIKDGAGTLKLSGANTYTGDTTVQDGTLALAGNSAIVDSTALRLTNSAGVELEAGVDETVAEMYLAGVQSYGGTWGSSSSTAQHRDDSIFSGSGILTVSNGDNITNRAVSGVAATSAEFNAWVKAIVTNQDVYVYWGTSNGATTASAWENSAYVGSWTNVASLNISYTNTSLIWGTVYYYAFRASNAVQSVWACPSETFSTIGPPTVDNGSGPTTLSETSATLRGELIAGVSADAWICWGTNDAGTVSTSDWQNVASIGSVTLGVEFSTDATGLATNQTYWYRTYATNSDGVGWAATAEVFSGTPVGGGSGAQIAIYREATAADAITTANFDHSWDTTVRVDSAVYNLNGTGIECAAGHHLVLYSSRFDDPGDNGSNRAEIQSHLRLNGADLSIGWSQGYIRRQSGDFEAICAGGGIIEVASAGDPVVLRSFRTDSDGDTVQREPNGSGIQLLKLDDSWDYCRLSLSTNVAGPNTSFVPITYDTQDELDTGSFSHTAGSEDVTLEDTGRYLVLANTYLQHFHSQRSGYQQRLTLGGTVITGSQTMVYIRGDQQGCNDGAVAAAMIISNGVASQVLNLECKAEDVDPSPQIIGGKTALTIVKLPDAGDYIRLGSASGNFNPGATAALTWADELEGGSSFSHSGTQISVTKDDDYLFFCALFDDDDADQRVQWWQRWRKNGSSIYPYGTSGAYNRGVGDGSGTGRETGNRSAIIVDLANGDYVETVAVQLGNTGTMDPDFAGLQGVRLASILQSTPIANLAPTSITNNQATLNASLQTPDTNYTVYVHWGTTDGGTNLGSWDIYHEVGSWTNVASTNISYLKGGLSGQTAYWYTFRASNDAGNAWAEPSWTFVTPSGLSDAGSVFIFK